MGVRENPGRAGLRTQRSCLASSGLLNLPEPQFPAPRGTASAQARSPPAPTRSGRAHAPVPVPFAIVMYVAAPFLL